MKTFLTSDHHFGHNNMAKFGTRPWGPGEADAMTEFLVEKWNSIVGPNDKVYHLGDFAIPKRAVKTAGRLNGRKVLVRGNHDIYSLSEYTPYFYDVRGSHKLDVFVLSHIPIHPGSIARWSGGNIHGHLHEHRVKDLAGQIDPRYLCVSVEHTDYAPIDFEEVRQIMKEQQENYNGTQPSV